jgi:hypothetical protein
VVWRCPGWFPDPLAERLLLIRPHMDQRAWRPLLGAEAKVLGRGGMKTVAAATGAHPDTVAQGVRELDYPEPIPGRIRRPGAGRPGATVTDRELLGALDALVVTRRIRNQRCGGRRNRPRN